MKLKLLLFSLLFASGALYAQDTIKTLIISEARLDGTHAAYVEFSNVGSTTINLSEFEFGHIGAWTIPWNAEEVNHIMLPNVDLAPGESFTIANVHDWNPEQWLKNPDEFSRRITKDEKWILADMQNHIPEDLNNSPTDSVSYNYNVLDVWNGRDCLYLEYHLSNGDSAVVDQVNGNFDEEDDDGNRTNYDSPYDVAGVTDATVNSILIRKFKVKEGNPVFEPGTDALDSEWIVVPLLFGGWEPNRAVFWTFGNHVNATLADLTSSTLTVDMDNSTITVPWGVRNDDSIMYQFDRVPGIAWHYDYSSNHEDSGYVSVRTGDILTIYACGDEVEVKAFNLVAAAPMVSDAIVIPKRTKGSDGYYGQNAGALFDVTDMVPGMDSIREVPFGMHVDTMLKYLEKAPNATWEFVWVDGVERTAVVTGDKLKVTAEDGSTVKEYYIQVEDYRPSHNAYLASITWPDIPPSVKGLYGWVGDTIPNFGPNKLEYKVTVPYVATGIPALVAKTQDVNAYFDVNRATNLFGSVANRTVTFTVHAEDDTTINIYKVVLEKQKHPNDVQPWQGEPFISQFIFQEYWANGIVEIVNPGNLPLDLSKYMFSYMYTTDPATAITNDAGVDQWGNRWNKYIPGYKWVDEATWAVTPARVIPDDAVKSIVQPGDVFVMTSITSNWDGDGWSPDYSDKHIIQDQTDLDFLHNPWGETIPHWGNAAHQWLSATFFMYEILNDSVINGTKAANDPADFRLIDVMGSSDGSETWTFMGDKQIQQINGFIRKSHIYKGNTSFASSYGTNVDDSEWLLRDRAFYQALSTPWPNDVYYVCDGIGSHFMDDVTIYRSTVSSLSYKVSQGYSLDEEIRGVVDNTTVDDFLAKIIKADEGQTLTLKASADGAILTGTDVLLNGDTLIVVSADMTNTSKYVLEVTAAGLSDDAVLTSTTLTVNNSGSTGTIEGFAYGTTLAQVVAAVQVPDGASMVIIDAQGAYVPLKTLNNDTVYVDVLASSKYFFEVTAEDGQTMITYQLMPTTLATDAFVFSSFFEIDQDQALIMLVPQGTTVAGLLQNLVPSTGATMVLVDKLGHERTTGDVVADDRLIVTAQDGETQRVYYLSMLEQTGFLAYVLSDVYEIDQVDLIIYGVFESTTTAEFLGNLIPAPQASLVLLNSSGEENTTGDVDAGDVLKVTSGNGAAVVYYDIEIDYTGIDPENSSIRVYPNPNNGEFLVSGLTVGSRIQVYSLTGSRLQDITANGDTEAISLRSQANGIYFLVISNDEGVTGRYKVIKK